MDFIFIKSSKAGKEDYGSIYARVRTGKANMKVVTGFTIKQLEWEKYRSLQYTSSALMSSIGIKYGQFAQVLARIKAAFEADGFNPKEAKNIIESVKHDVLNGMMQIVEVKPKGRMLFEDFLTSYIEDMETGRRTKKGRTVKVSPAYIKGLRIIQRQIRNYQKETHRKLGLDDMTMEMSLTCSSVLMWVMRHLESCINFSSSLMSSDSSLFFTASLVERSRLSISCICSGVR